VGISDTNVSAGTLLTIIFSAGLTWLTMEVQEKEQLLEAVKAEAEFSRQMIIVLCGQSNEHYRSSETDFSNECSDWATSHNGVWP
jgi:hypothetical protein